MQDRKPSPTSQLTPLPLLNGQSWAEKCSLLSSLTLLNRGILNAPWLRSYSNLAAHSSTAGTSFNIHIYMLRLCPTSPSVSKGSCSPQPLNTTPTPPPPQRHHCCCCFPTNPSSPCVGYVCTYKHKVKPHTANSN